MNIVRWMKRKFANEEKTFTNHMSDKNIYPKYKKTI